MNDDYIYKVECTMCDSITVVTCDVDERPGFCCMCGDQVEDDNVVLQRGDV